MPAYDKTKKTTNNLLIIMEIMCYQTFASNNDSGMPNLGTKGGQIGTKWDKSGTFKDQISVPDLSHSVSI